MKNEKITISKLTKQWGLWKTKGNVMSPLMYFQKPKDISPEKFEDIINSLEIYILPDKEANK